MGSTIDIFGFVLFIIIIIAKVSNESHNTRLGGMKQELRVFQSDFSIQLSDLSNSLNEKFNNLYKLFDESEGKIKTNINDTVTSVKDSIIEALKAEN